MKISHIELVLVSRKPTHKYYHILSLKETEAGHQASTASQFRNGKVKSHEPESTEES